MRVTDKPKIKDVVEAGILVKKLIPFKTTGASKRAIKMAEIRGTKVTGATPILEITDKGHKLGFWHDEFPCFIDKGGCFDLEYPEHDDIALKEDNGRISETTVEIEAYTFKDHPTYTAFMHGEVGGVYTEEYKEYQDQMHAERLHICESVDDAGETVLTVYQVHETEEMPEKYSPAPSKTTD